MLGKNGMLGSMFLKLLENFRSGGRRFEIFAFDRDLDITDREALEASFARIKPDFVVNCAAYTNVDLAESERDLAFKINGEGPGLLAGQCKIHGAKLIHFSTDYVFDGEKVAGYVEDDAPSPINIYGESKLAGEKAIAAEMNDYFIVRTSWLFGPGGKNFVDTMVQLGGEVLSGKREELKVVDDQVGCPTYTFDLAEAVLKDFLMPFLDADAQVPDFGIYHVTNSEKCSWYEFAREIFKVRSMEVNVQPISSEDFVRPAKRPKSSVLLSTKLDFEMRSWKEAVADYIAKTA